jgi:hypothetical protein
MHKIIMEDAAGGSSG